MKANKFLWLPGMLSAALAGIGAAADTPQQVLLQRFALQAKKENPGFRDFSPEAGQAFYFHQPSHRGKGEAQNCAACHGQNPRENGQTRAGKQIAPMAVAINPERFTDAAKVEKWFKRNCKDVLGRECSWQEKGDFLAYLLSLR